MGTIGGPKVATLAVRVIARLSILSVSGKPHSAASLLPHAPDPVLAALASGWSLGTALDAFASVLDCYDGQ